MLAKIIMKFHVKGYWSDEGIFNGAVYKDNRKFGTCVRVRMDMVTCESSLGKEDVYREFKRWLIENKRSRYEFLMDEIDDYIVNNPTKRLKLI